jgi:hypothetical protein
MEPKKTARRSKLGLDVSRQNAASSKAGSKAETGNTPYRDEYLVDHGPDPDEPLDVTESGHEF